MLIYLVDDDKGNNFLTRVMLEDAGYIGQSVSFQSANEALQSLLNAITSKSKLPSFIMLDINLPGMDGWEFIDEFSKLNPEATSTISIHMLSSSVNPADESRARKHPSVTSFLPKPLSEEDAQLILSPWR